MRRLLEVEVIEGEELRQLLGVVPTTSPGGPASVIGSR